MFVIPGDRLPAGFAARVDEPPDPPAQPLPAASVVLLRDSAAGPETLLLRRHQSSGFVPGAYVFPGGRLDEGDDDPGLVGGIAESLQRGGVGSGGGGADAAAGPLEPPAACWAAGMREVFEETGVLLAADRGGRPAPDAAAEPHLAEWRERLMNARAGLAALLEAERLEPALGDVVYFAHWITPLAEPRRYDTRFFLARLPDGRQVAPDPREMTDALWLTPAAALARFQAGSLPMVFPTVKVLETLVGFSTVADALDGFRGQSVETVLPRLVRAEGGVGIVVD